MNPTQLESGMNPFSPNHNFFLEYSFYYNILLLSKKKLWLGEKKFIPDSSWVGFMELI